MENTFHTIRLYPSKKQFVIDNAHWIVSFTLFAMFFCYTIYFEIFSSLKIPFLLIIVLVFLLLLYQFVFLSSLSYFITDEQLKYEHGVFSRTCDYIELYRIVDYVETQSFLQMLVGIKTVSLYSGDHTSPRFDMIGIDNNLNLLEILRTRVEYNKKKHNIHEFANIS